MCNVDVSLQTVTVRVRITANIAEIFPVLYKHHPVVEANFLRFRFFQIIPLGNHMLLR